jgi:hypothetical protein
MNDMRSKIKKLVKKGDSQQSSVNRIIGFEPIKKKS